MALQPVHAGEKITYIHNDALGSPVAATNQLGQVIWRETYKPHGQRTTNAPASVNNKVWFTGKQEEAALGINYFGARWYHPEIGRFLVIDPAGVAPNNIHSFNRYAYANNNPYKYVDPDGRAAAAVFYMGGAVAAGASAAYGSCAGSGGPWCTAVRGLGDRLIQGIGGLVNNEGTESQDEVKGEAGTRFPDRQLPRDPNGNPTPDPEAEGSYTQLGQKDGRAGKYDQAREFNAKGVAVRDIDFTDHGRPADHANPHQHEYSKNPTGGTPRRGSAKSMD